MQHTPNTPTVTFRHKHTGLRWTTRKLDTRVAPYAVTVDDPTGVVTPNERRFTTAACCEAFIGRTLKGVRQRQRQSALHALAASRPLPAALLFAASAVAAR